MNKATIRAFFEIHNRVEELEKNQATQTEILRRLTNLVEKLHGQ